MDIREIGVCGAVVIGGAAFGFGQFGLNDVLTSELKHISDVARQDRSTYMSTVVADFAESFDSYEVHTETYAYIGQSEFGAEPLRGMFTEVVKQDSRVPAAEIPKLRARLPQDDFCAQDEMTMFTDMGWTYRFTLQDSTGRRIATVTCTSPAKTGQV